MSAKNRLTWQAGDRLINRNDRRQAQVHSAETGITLIVKGGGIVVAKQAILENSGWERMTHDHSAEDTDRPTAGY